MAAKAGKEIKSIKYIPKHINTHVYAHTPLVLVPKLSASRKSCWLGTGGPSSSKFKAGTKKSSCLQWNSPGRNISEPSSLLVINKHAEKMGIALQCQQ